MGYYIRVFGTSDPDIHVEHLVSALADDNLFAKILLSGEESPDNWTELDVANESGETIMVVERNPVAEGELGQEELGEFQDEISDCEPNSAVKWLGKYLQKVKVIYAFQLLSAAMEDDNYAVVSCIKTAIWTKTGGILQADNEGFSNEQGYHILWQFADDVEGEWNMAVRTTFGGWTNFTMDLGNPEHRKAFKARKVPR